MDRRVLQPEQIIVPGEYKLGNESILQIYFRVFDRGHGGDLPPVIVAHRDSADMFHDVTELDSGDVNYRNHKTFYENYNRILHNAFNSGAEYFLLDGNHKSVAATLTHEPLSALELQVDEDIQRGKQMIESGELFNWTIPGETLDESMAKLRNHLEGYLRENVEGIHLIGTVIDTFPLTVKERVDLLTANGDLPQYMKERYHRVK